VLIAEPYKSELLPHWKFATAAEAETSANRIYAMFKEYKAAEDFVGMDMARKFLQMGFTRARRYANHANGKKYTANHRVRPQDHGSETSEKAHSARIFYTHYVKARSDKKYTAAKADHQARQRRPCLSPYSPPRPSSPPQTAG
jgi:Domain of unknown function (DUF4385)